jgi:uncharacterized protein YjiS (DUF1127 family)
MDLPHRLANHLGASLREAETARALARLDDRRLADIGLARRDVRLAARLAARSEPTDVPLGELVRRVRDARDAHAEAAARANAALAAVPRVSREDLDRYVAEGRRLREEEIAKLLRRAGRGLAGLAHALAAPLAAAIDATGLPEQLELALARRREYRRVRRELAAYSERELMADLRLVPSEIPDVAAEAAAIRAAEFARGARRRGRVALGGAAAGAAAGPLGA